MRYPRSRIRIVTACNAYEPMREALAKLVTTSQLLLQNAEGCAVNHYGEDFQKCGRPGWLADCENDIVTARTALSTLPVNDRQTSDDVGRLREVLTPFSEIAGELFAQNYNKDDVVTQIGDIALTFEPFLNARAALKGVPQPASSPEYNRLEELLVAAYERGANWAWKNTEISKEYVGKAARDYADYTMHAPASEAGKLSTDAID